MREFGVKSVSTVEESVKIAPTSKPCENQGHERIPSMTYVTKSHRRQWETSSPEKLKSMYRSFSQLDIREKKEVRTTKPSPSTENISSSKVTRLPPIKNDSRNLNCKNPQKVCNRTSHHTQTNCDFRRRSHKKPKKEPSVEFWYVPKPTRHKPQDHGIFEREPVVEQRSKSRSSDRKGQVKGEERTITAQPQIFHISRSSYRPRTSLKPGGQGFYQTVNRDSFKRFVVVDINNNEHSSKISIDEVKVDGKGRVSEQVNVCSKSSEFKELPDEKSKWYVKRDISCNEIRGRQPSIEPPSAKISEEVQCVMCRHSLSPKLDKEIQVRVEKEMKDESMQSNAIDGEAPSVTKERDTVDVDRSRIREKRERSSIDRSYHSSLPRTVIRQNKNDSQIKFENMTCVGTDDQGDFSAKRKISQRRHTRGTRDLFKESEDFWTMNADDSKRSTYASFFKERSTCPVLDLETPRSDYKFKVETSGHKFYCLCDRL